MDMGFRALQPDILIPYRLIRLLEQGFKITAVTPTFNPHASEGGSEIGLADGERHWRALATFSEPSLVTE